MVLIVAIALLLAVSLLVTAVVWGAVASNTASNLQLWRNEALATANAGLQTADQRLTDVLASTGVAAGDCFTTVDTGSGPGASGCPGQTESYGGGSYTYYVTPLSGSSGADSVSSCTGWPVTSPTGIVQRCITSVGTYDGVARRVQERVISGPAGLFPITGVYSYTDATYNNSVTITGNLGASGTLKLNQTPTFTQPGDLYWGTSLQATCTGNCTSVHQTFPLPTESATSTACAAVTYPCEGFATSLTTNNNANITGATVGASRILGDSGGGAITIPAGTYNLCGISQNNAENITYTPPVVIYIDSPYRSGSGCGGGTGTILSNNKTWFIDTSSPAKTTDLQFFVWGNPGQNPPSSSSPILSFNNIINGPMTAAIYAPYSYLSINNDFNFAGSMAAGDVQINGKLTLAGGAVSAGSSTFSEPSAWATCPATPSTSTDPNSGCY